MRYNKSYQLTRDIDWFFQLNNKPIHVASAGGKLPNQINDRTQLQKQQHLVSTLSDINTIAEIRINHEFIKELCEKTMCEEDVYLESFISMAKKGFISMDKTHIDDPEETTYHVVCIPTNYYSGDEIQLINITQEDIDLTSGKQVLFDLSELFEDLWPR